MDNVSRRAERGSACLNRFDYDRWLSTPAKTVYRAEEDEDEEYDGWIDRQLCEMD